ncbi:hypothetical protein EBBID32_18580 [Sphingobium indicum BiD32]|uniref:Uncharacterized protein n=1 Tax=Sphingobium indicum BiD32 TaxID=1301087 RepID=N1MPD7_9SPHN|nr:hypothetical protein EBBID32_18580 [Sphingobium indicum BiD32]
MGEDGIGTRRDRRIGFGQFDQRNFRRAERQAQILGHGRGDAEVTGDLDDIVDADLLRQADGGDVARRGEGLTQADAAAIFAAMIGRAVAAGGDRCVVDHILRRHARAESGEINEQLEGGPRLAFGLHGAVEAAPGVILPADHGDDAAVGLHRHQRRLRPAQRRAADRGFGEALDAPVERGVDLLFAIDRARPIPRIGQHPIGEIGAGGGVGGFADVEPGGREGVAFRLCDVASVHHRLRHQRGAGAGAFQVAGRGKARGRLEQARQQRGLRNGQPFGRAVEIMERGGAQAVHIVAEIDVGEIPFEDLILGQPGFEPEGDHRLARLAAHGTVAGEEHALGELLGDGAAALRRSVRPEIMPGGAGDAARIDTPMAVEAPVLYRHEGLGHMGGQLGDRDRRVDHRAAPGDQVAILRHQADAGRGDRPERAGERRGDGQPADQQHQDGETSRDDPAENLHPASPGRGRSEGAGRPGAKFARGQRGRVGGAGRIGHRFSHAVLFA